ncbi:Uncharacterised protein [Neisseria zoodegmatis]|uniref:Lipoprotein signal peptidase n=1 Tax=Neisseria zoodegmatis TaxID=326523 RepID=A0A378WRN3_9NEIS|nr:Uncharacterised protein [Neisseria zoodegmatis]
MFLKETEAESARSLQNPHLQRISALCAARSFAYLIDMSALAVLLPLELHLHLRVLQKSQPDNSSRFYPTRNNTAPAFSDGLNPSPVCYNTHLQDSHHKAV